MKNNIDELVKERQQKCSEGALLVDLDQKKAKGYTTAKHIQSHSQGKENHPHLEQDECFSDNPGTTPLSPQPEAGLDASFPAKVEDTKTILESMGVDYVA